MNTPVEARPESCSFCPSNVPVRPRVVQVRKGAAIVTEAHWVCGSCGNRFKIGVLNTQSEQK